MRNDYRYVDPDPTEPGFKDNFDYRVGTCDTCQHDNLPCVEWWATSAANWRAPVLQQCLVCATDPWPVADRIPVLMGYALTQYIRSINVTEEMRLITNRVLENSGDSNAN
jgi:hypothetical protein